MKLNTLQTNRRSILKAVGMLGAAASISPVSALAQLPKADVVEHQGMDLSFVAESGIGPVMDAPYVEEHFIPLHDEIPLPPMSSDTQEFQMALSVLKGEFEAMGKQWQDSFHLSWTYQHYGVPDRLQHVEPIVAYCNSVRSYLYDNLRGLEDLSLNWEPIRLGQTVSGSNRALVGKYTYFVLRVNAVDENGIVQEPYLVNASPVERAIHYISSEVEKDPNRLIYVIQGTTSLVSPFSEMIHLSTHEPAMRYASALRETHNHDDAKNIARSFGETITESAAVLLALNFLQDINKEKYSRQIIRHANSLSSQLPQFSGSIAYMQKYGIQAAFDSFSEDPKRYMDRIENMG